MDSHITVGEHNRNNGRNSRTFLVSCLAMGMVTGCLAHDSNAQNYDGAIYIAPLGSPPADSIVWSPKEDKILVTAGDVGEGRAEIYEFEINANQKRFLAKVDYGDYIESTWAPDGKHILVLAGPGALGSGAEGLWVLEPTGASAEYLLDSGYAAWSPDGRTIATFSTKDDHTTSRAITLSLFDVEHHTVKKIYENLNMKFFFGLSWSPDGQNLAFGLADDATKNLYIINIGTAQVTRIEESIRGTEPVWSPVGNIIAYVSWPSEGINTSLHLIDLEGKCDIQIPNLEYVWSPTWSPDGKRLGYIGPDGLYYLQLDKYLEKDIYQNLC